MNLTSIYREHIRCPNSGRIGKVLVVKVRRGRKSGATQKGKGKI